MPGPSRTPRHLRLLKGTLRPCRDGGADQSAKPTLPPVDQAAPPDWLTDARAVAEWQRLSRIMLANRLLTEGNRDMLAHLCMLISRFADIWSAGRIPPAALLAQYRVLSGSLHLSALNLTAAAPGKPENRFSKLAEFSRRARDR